MSEPKPPKIDRGEKWRDIPGYEGRYMVSSYGRVYSLPRLIERSSRSGVQSGYYVAGKICKFCKYPPGKGDVYSRISLYDGTRKSFTVHSLVALAFIGPRPHGLVVRHIDLDGRNCRASNLEYGTQSQNNVDYRRSGKPLKKLMIKDAREIRFLKDAGFTTKDLADAYGVSNVAISYVVRNKFLKEEHEY